MFTAIELYEIVSHSGPGIVQQVGQAVKGIILACLKRVEKKVHFLYDKP